MQNLFRYERKKKRQLRKSRHEHTFKIIWWVSWFRGYSFSKAFLDMIPAVFGKLKDSGFFFDPIARDIEINFMPNLLSKVKSKVNFKISRPKF